MLLTPSNSSQRMRARQHRLCLYCWCVCAHVHMHISAYVCRFLLEPSGVYAGDGVELGDAALGGGVKAL